MQKKIYNCLSFKLNKVVFLCVAFMLQCTVLLLVVWFKFEFPEFKFELNCMNQFQKIQSHFFFLFLFSAQQAHLFLPLPLFPFLSRGPKLYRRLGPSPSPRPSSAPLPLSHRQVGYARRTPLPPRARLGLEPESGRGTPPHTPGPARRGPVLAPIKARCPLPESPRACATASRKP